MANLVSKIMLKMKLVSSDKVVFVNNALELLGSYVGQTPAKVDAKVAEAKGGIMFIDEAYSIVKGGGDRDSNGGQFGREAIDTIMKVRATKRGSRSSSGPWQSVPRALCAVSSSHARSDADCVPV